MKNATLSNVHSLLHGIKNHHLIKNLIVIHLKFNDTFNVMSRSVYLRVCI
jgi:hypothetical protein